MAKLVLLTFSSTAKYFTQPSQLYIRMQLTNSDMKGTALCSPAFPLAIYLLHLKDYYHLHNFQGLYQAFSTTSVVYRDRA